MQGVTRVTVSDETASHRATVRLVARVANVARGRALLRVGLAVWSSTALVSACAPHEPSNEPGPSCAEGMARVEGGRDGARELEALCVDVHEVTTAAFATCVDAGACASTVLQRGERCNLIHGERGAHPVNCVTGRDAQAYCSWLGKRLPSTREWDWIARGRAPGARYPWGAEPIDDTRACWSGQVERSLSCEIGGRPAGASPEGVADLVGNVAEWTERVGQGGEGGAEKFEARGGGWAARASRDTPEDVEPGEKDTKTSSGQPEARGFRCVAPLGQAVRAVDDGTWTPLDPAPRELPVLVKRPAPRRPARPLQHLAPLWHHVPEEGDTPKRLWQLGEEVVAIEPAAARTLQLTGGIDGGAKPAALRDFWPRWIADEFVLMGAGYSGDRSFVAVAPEGYTLKWQAAPVASGRSYLHFVAPRVLVAEFYGDAADVIVGVALVDGHELWRVAGGEDAPFTRARDMWFDGERGYVLGDRGLSAFDPVTGQLRWSELAVGERCGVATGDGVLVIEDPGAGHRRIDAATGTLRGRIQTGVSGACSWGASSYDGGVTPAVIAGGRMFAYDPPQADGRATLRGFNLASGAELWKLSKATVGPLVADADALYSAGTRGAIAARDPMTGAAVAEVSLGDSFAASIAHAGGPAGPLVVVTTDNGGTWILGRDELPPVPEAYTITGRLVPDEYLRKRSAARVKIAAGTRETATDRAGRFTIRGRAIGAIAVEMANPPEDYDFSRGYPSRELVRFDRQLVVLDGRGPTKSYDLGDIPLYEWSIE